MPELPEVEITRRGIEPHLKGRVITAIEVREPRLRWPISPEVRGLPGNRIASVKRRGKYLVMDCGNGFLILHLGMSGSLRIVQAGERAGKHDHFDLAIGDRLLRLRDPRRFGAVLWTAKAPDSHRLLAGLGVEPLSAAFNAKHLHSRSRGHRVAIKVFLMDAKNVVGVGNIYASEALFRAGINPRTRAGRLSAERCARLVAQVKATLKEAIRAGGSTRRDFVRSDGSPGYAQQNHLVYDRAGEPCRYCGTAIRRVVMGQRATYFCPSCQK